MLRIESLQVLKYGAAQTMFNTHNTAINEKESILLQVEVVDDNHNPVHKRHHHLVATDAHPRNGRVDHYSVSGVLSLWVICVQVPLPNRTVERSSNRNCMFQHI
jgi:hypothetical protein